VRGRLRTGWRRADDRRAVRSWSTRQRPGSRSAEEGRWLNDSAQLRGGHGTIGARPSCSSRAAAPR
jgi:hypothetical protein